MKRMRDMSGMKFGEWEVLGFDGVVLHGKNTRTYMWKCRCSCGKTRLVCSKRLRNGTSTGCGHNQKTRKRHGMTGTPTWITWMSMKARTVHNTKNQEKKIYYAHVFLDERWLVFENFLSDMGIRPDGKTLDRIDPSKGYFAANCRWATDKEQNASEHKRPRGTVRSVHSDRWAELCVISGLMDKKIRTRLGQFDLPPVGLVRDYAKKKYGEQFKVLLGK